MSIERLHLRHGYDVIVTSVWQEPRRYVRVNIENGSGTFIFKYFFEAGREKQSLLSGEGNFHS